VAAMSCNLEWEWVGVEDVERLWAQFAHQAYDSARALRLDSAMDNSRFAAETLDLWLWCVPDGGYWWCDTCNERHIVD